MQMTVRTARAVRGSLAVAGNKSISHRAAIFNTLAEGEAVIQGFQRGADCLATLFCLRQLGVDWSWKDEATLVVKGKGPRAFREPASALDCRNSGTTMRLLAGLLAAQPFSSVLTGDSSLQSRPMARVIDPLRLMGATIAGRDHDRVAPLSIRGNKLHGIRYEMPVASAQVKSAILLAGLYAEGETVVREPERTRDHTERMLKAMGAPVEYGEGPAVRVKRLEHALAPLSLRISGDISSAAPWLVLASLHDDAELRLTAVGTNPTRTGILDALHEMGADVRVENEQTWGGEPVADLVVRSSALRGTTIRGDARNIDELPILALAGCLATGETVISEAQELRVKESDRIRTTVTELRKLGAKIEERPDGMLIHGDRPLQGAVVSSHGDHRLAMMLAIAGSLASGETVIRGAESVAVSYPDFWRHQELLTGK